MRHCLVNKQAGFKLSVAACFFVTAIIFLSLGLAFSQDSPPFPRKAAQDNLAGQVKDSEAEGLKTESLETSRIKYFFNRLSESEQKTFFSKLNNAEKMGLLKGLSMEERKKFFLGLDLEEKLIVFPILDIEERHDLFSNLVSNEEKIALYKVIEEEERGRFLSRMSNADRNIILAEEKERPEIKEEVFVQEEPPSTIEKILSGDFPTDISRQLSQYGYKFFDKAVSTFTPVTDVPVGGDYRIGPGDEFTIHVWGKAELSYDAVVSREGAIFLPRLGNLNVSGLSFDELKGFLYRKFRDYYPDFKLGITMGRLRTIDVFLVGEARYPGTYSISSLSTVISALSGAGGPSKSGSLRNIRVMRNGELKSTLDLYDFFVHGKTKDDVRLRAGDTILIPVLGPVAGVAGAVRRPAIYEMKGSQTIKELIDLAGGVLHSGQLQNVVIERIEGHRRRVVKSFNLDPANESADLNMCLKDGDVIKIYPVHEGIRQVVYLEGHVKYPREYELKADIRLSSLISSYDDLLPEAFMRHAEIIRSAKPDLHKEIIPFDLGGLLAGDPSQDMLLQDLDRVKVYPAWEKEAFPEVHINGAVRSPGTYRLFKGMTTKDLIFQADNLQNRAFDEKATLTRIIPGPEGADTIKLDFSPKKALMGLSPDNMVLEKDDTVIIREMPKYGEALGRKIVLEGAVLFPGEYTFVEGNRLSSIIEKAGGLTEDAYPFGAKFYRKSAQEIQEERLMDYVSKLEEDLLTMTARASEAAVDKDEAAIYQQVVESKKMLLEKLKGSRPTGRMVIDLQEAMAISSSEHNLKLRAGDRLFVPKKSVLVNVIGEVFNPTALLAVRDENVAHYLAQVGGPTRDADDDQVYLVKANGSVMSKSQEGFLGLASWDTGNQRWTMGGFDSVTVHPGDTIIVPKKLERYPWLRITKDITQTLYQIAASAGVIIAALD